MAEIIRAKVFQVTDSWEGYSGVTPYVAYDKRCEENLALRQQLVVYQRQRNRPQLRDRDRLFWILLKRLWGGWRDVLVIVQPATVVR